MLELTVGGRDFSIHQSPTILSSNRAEGTTGAGRSTYLGRQSKVLNSIIFTVLWKISPSFAEWVSSRQNVLFENDILNSNSTVLELGCGVSGIVSLALGARVGKYIATDQDYALKLLKQNIARNAAKSSPPDRQKSRRSRDSQKKVTKATDSDNIQVMALDWELDSLHTLPDLLKAEHGSLPGSDMEGVDALVACDCIYNEALVEPFVKTCAEICRLRGDEPAPRSTVCIVAQQLRSPEVFETWLAAFHAAFHVWRLPDNLLTESLKQNSGFVVHLGTVKI